MIDRSEVINLIEQLAGDEHDWVDLKQDYYIDNPDIKKADFVKDVVAMANTITDKDTHYIFIGVEDESGSLVGVSDDFNKSSGARHIIGEDESNIQEILNEYLSPKPNVSLYKFIDEDPKFGLLSISPIEKKPCMIQKSIQFNGEIKLQKGLIYFRDGSSNTIASRSDIERIIDQRVENRREEILEGIRKATEIGPEAVASVGDIVYEEEGDVAVEVGEQGDFVMEERLSREPVPDIDDRLTIAIKQWATEESVQIDSTSLWEYYSSVTEISIDKESILFLTKASIENGVFGGFWLSYTDIENARNILHSIEGGYHKQEKVSKILCASGDCEGLESYYGENSINEDLESFSELLEHCEAGPETRLDNLLSNKQYDVGYSEWSRSFDLTTMNKEELRKLIQELSCHLSQIEERIAGYGKWYHKKEDFTEALRDAEIALMTRCY